MVLTVDSVHRTKVRARIDLEISHFQIRNQSFPDKKSVISRQEFSHFQIISRVFVLFDLNLYVPSTIIQLCRDVSSWVEPVLG